MPIGRIQREAAGVLPFLDIVGQQMRPIALDEVVTGTLDMLPFYGSGLLGFRGSTGNVQNVNDAVTFNLPAGTAMLLLSLQAEVTTGAINEDAGLSVAVATPNLGIVRIAAINRAPSTAFPVGSRLFVSGQLTKPILLMPGAGFRMSVEWTTLTAARAASVFGLGYLFST